MLRYSSLSAILLLFITAILLLPGCRQKGLKGVVPISGKITLNGEPLAGVSVNFSPTDMKAQRGAAARSAEDGTFSLTTFNKDDGAFPGTYKVTLAKLVFSMTQEEIDKLIARGNTNYNLSSENIMPKQYQSAATTPLTCEVKPDKNETFVIDITEPLLKSKYSKKREK